MRFTTFVATAALAVAGQTAYAQGFEGGVPAGWTCDGLCGALGADGDVTLAPTAASKYGYVVSGEDTPSDLSPFAFGGEKTGSRLRSAAFSADAGDPLKFYFNYITSDGAGFADYGFARLLKADDFSQVALLFTARTKPSGSIVPGQDMPLPEATLTPGEVPIIANPNANLGPSWSPLGTDSTQCFDIGCGYTGWIESSFNIVAGGEYVLEFGVVNWSDAAYQSGMAFDGITVAGVPLVPEPETYALMLLGLGLMGGALRRRRSA